MEVFDQYMPQPNQVDNKRHDFATAGIHLISLPQGTITEQGLRLNINVGILYIESWLRGNGAAAIYNLMEDAATAEISRTQVWQWLHSKARLEDGRTIDQDLYENVRDEEIENIRQEVGAEAYHKGSLPKLYKSSTAWWCSGNTKSFLLRMLIKNWNNSL